MTKSDMILVFLVWIPLVVVWLIVMVDLIRRPRMSASSKVAWAAACTLVWPLLIAYLLVRPTLGRLEMADQRNDAQSRLVSAVLDHESGRIDDAAMADAIRHLRATRIAIED